MTLALAQTATDAYYDSTTVLVPEDGDDLDAMQVEAALQKLSNRVQHTRGATWGTLAWSGTLAVSGTAAAPVVVVGAIESCPLRDASNVWRPYFTSGETTLGAAHVEGGGALAADAWYYVYAWSDSAAPTALKFQISTTPPTDVVLTKVPRLWKRGETANFRYLGSFYAGTGGNPRPVRAARGQYVYRASALAFPAVFADVAAVGWTDTSLAAVLPPHARLATMRVRLENLDLAGPALVEFRTKGDTTASVVVDAGFAGSAVAGQGAINTCVVEIETDSAQLIQRHVTGASPLASGAPVGWRE